MARLGAVVEEWSEKSTVRGRSFGRWGGEEINLPFYPLSDYQIWGVE